MEIRDIIDLLLKNGLAIIIFVLWVVGAILKLVKQRRGALPTPPRAPVTGAALRPASAAPARHGVGRRHPLVAPMLKEAREVLDRAREQETTRKLAPWIERGFVDPLQRLSMEGWARGEILEMYQIYGSLLKDGIEQRSPAALDPPQGRFLLDLEVLCGRIRDQVGRALGGARNLPIRHLLPVYVRDDYALPAYDLQPVFGSGIALVPVPARSRLEVWRWALLYHEMAHLLWGFQPGLAVEIARRVGLRAGPVPLLALSFLSKGNLAKHLVGVWLPEIFADTVTTIALGPAAAAGARALFRGLGAEERSLVRGLDVGTGTAGLHYDPHPPPHLRFALITRVLRQIGFAAEGARAWERWTREHGPADDLLLEMPGGYGRPVPAGSFLTEIDLVIDRLLHTRFRSVGGRGLADLPGLALSVEEHGDIARAVNLPTPDLLRRAESPRWVIAFAALAHERDHRTAVEAARRVLAYHARGEPLEEAPERVKAAPAEGAAAVGEWAELLREAVVWREILMPPIAKRPPGARGHPRGSIHAG